MHFVSIYTWTLLKTALNDSEDADHKQSIPQLQENCLFFSVKRQFIVDLFYSSRGIFFPVEPAALHKFVFSSPPPPKKKSTLENTQPRRDVWANTHNPPLQTNSVIMSMHVQTDSFENIAPKKHTLK